MNLSPFVIDVVQSTPVETGYAQLDEVWHLFRSELSLLIYSGAQGASTLAYNIFIRQKKKTVYLTTDPYLTAAKALIAVKAGASAKSLRDTSREQLQKAVDELNDQTQLEFESISPNTNSRKLREFLFTKYYGAELVILDTLPAINFYELSSIAGDFGAHIIVLYPIPQYLVNSRDDHRPTIFDITVPHHESKLFANILAVFRKSYYDKSAPHILELDLLRLNYSPVPYRPPICFRKSNPDSDRLEVVEYSANNDNPNNAITNTILEGENNTMRRTFNNEMESDKIQKIFKKSGRQFTEQYATLISQIGSNAAIDQICLERPELSRRAVSSRVSVLNSAILQGLLPAILRTLMAMPGTDTTMLNDELLIVEDEQRKVHEKPFLSAPSTVPQEQEGLFWEEGDTQLGDNIETDEEFEFFINL